MKGETINSYMNDQKSVKATPGYLEKKIRVLKFTRNRENNR